MRRIAVIVTVDCSRANECIIPQINAFLALHENVSIDLFYVLGSLNYQAPLLDSPRARVAKVSTGLYETPEHLLIKDASATETMSHIYFNKVACDMAWISEVAYDCILRLKHDVPFDLPEKLATTETFAENIVYVPDRDHGEGINSDIAWGSVSAMCKYGCVYDHIIETSGELPCPFKPQTLLHYIGTTFENIVFEKVP